MELIQDTAVFIIGPENLHNKFLAYVIERELKAKCILFPQIDKFVEQRKDQILNSLKKRLYLLLIDSIHTSLEEVLRHLSSYMHNSNIHVALFNLSVNTGIERNGLAKNIKGFFYKDDGLELFLKGIKIILLDELWISRKLLSKYVLQSFKDKQEVVKEKNNLTQREIEILSMVSLGSTNEEISESLNLSLSTVKTHLYNIYKKINVKNRFNAAIWASTNI
ncbi:MAG: response regulator transcription factor [Spirochaetales bacterium]|nr:response regulator transcription factor [Spirochaetales bacterium]